MSQLSLFHHNIKSISKLYDELELYLNSLEIKSSFIVLSETTKKNFMISMVIQVSIDIEKIEGR